MNESAPASTSASPLGGVAPPDQVIEAMLALTVVSSEVGEGERAGGGSVDVRAAGGVEGLDDQVQIGIRRQLGVSGGVMS